MAEPSQARARAYFNYCPDTGVLFHKERPRHEFRNEATYSRHLKRVGKPAGTINNEGYVVVHLDRRTWPAHKVIWLMQTGEWVFYPDNEIDHRDGQRSNNRWVNLRKVTKSENQRNGSQRVNNTSGVHGVNWKPKYNSTPGDGRWVARIWNGPRHIYLGSFKSLNEARIARVAAERALGFTGSDRPPSEVAKRREAEKARAAV